MKTQKHQTKLSLNINSKFQFLPLNQDICTDNESLTLEENNLENTRNDEASLPATAGQYVLEPGHREVEIYNRTEYHTVSDSTLKRQNNNKTYSHETKSTNLSKSTIYKNTSILHK